jgi:hypothetical protein
VNLSWGGLLILGFGTVAFVVLLAGLALFVADISEDDDE